MRTEVSKQLVGHGAQISSVGSQAHHLGGDGAQVHATMPDSGFPHGVSLTQLPNGAAQVQLLTEKGGAFVAGIDGAYHQQTIALVFQHCKRQIGTLWLGRYGGAATLLLSPAGPILATPQTPLPPFSLHN